jgi:hypothetical protein
MRPESSLSPGTEAKSGDAKTIAPGQEAQLGHVTCQGCAKEFSPGQEGLSAGIIRPELKKLALPTCQSNRCACFFDYRSLMSAVKDLSKQLLPSIISSLSLHLFLTDILLFR